MNLANHAYFNLDRQKGFPSAGLLPGETYRQHTIYEFKPVDLPADQPQKCSGGRDTIPRS